MTALFVEYVVLCTDVEGVESQVDGIPPQDLEKAIEAAKEAIRTVKLRVFQQTTQVILEWDKPSNIILPGESLKLVS